MKEYIITTKRLGLRNWCSSDIEPFGKMSQDKKVMEFFPKLLSKEECVDFIKRMQTHFQKYRFCYFAIDILETGEFIGFTGLLNQTYESKYTPCVDIGWRLKKSSWGNGYATEAAKSCLDYAFSELKLNDIYAFATINNKSSEKIMNKIGMNFIDTFNHPFLKEYDDLKKCIVYTKNKF